jgi:pilus assembly protein CpaF
VDATFCYFTFTGGIMYTREDYLKALGRLAPLYADDDVTEIMVDTPLRILVEIKGQLEEAQVQFESVDEIHKIIDALAMLGGLSKMPDQTIFEFSFPGGEARALGVLPPTASGGPILVIRKLVRTSGVTWEKLIEWGSISAEVLEFLKQAIRVQVNILIAGGPGSGKTVLLNRVVELISPEERVVIVERAHEIQADHPRALYLESGGQGKVTIEDLILTTTKMRPDWVIIGELLGAEAMKVVEIFCRGHSGMTNIHAESVEDALARLEALCLTANLGLGLGEIRNLVSAAFHLVLYQRRLPDGRRKIMDVAELAGLEEGRYVLNHLFRYNPESDCLEATGLKPG